MFDWKQAHWLTNSFKIVYSGYWNDLVWSGLKMWLNHLVEEPKVWIWVLLCFTQRLQPAESHHSVWKTKKFLVVMLSHHFLVHSSYKKLAWINAGDLTDYLCTCSALCWVVVVYCSLLSCACSAPCSTSIGIATEGVIFMLLKRSFEKLLVVLLSA